jgi:hypothetical protein
VREREREIGTDRQTDRQTEREHNKIFKKDKIYQKSPFGKKSESNQNRPLISDLFGESKFWHHDFQ